MSLDDMAAMTIYGGVSGDDRRGRVEDEKLMSARDSGRLHPNGIGVLGKGEIMSITYLSTEKGGIVFFERAMYFLRIFYLCEKDTARRCSASRVKPLVHSSLRDGIERFIPLHRRICDWIRTVVPVNCRPA